MINPLISVVMPVYNGEKYLKEAINSILNQSFSNFEFIILNDGSTDRTEEIILSYTDERIQYIKNETNLKIVKTLNKGIDIAKGSWIARMDADDIAMPYRFERQLQFLELTGVDICGSWIKYIGVSESCVIKYPKEDAAIKAELLFTSAFGHPTTIMRTNLAKQLHYDNTWEFVEDYDLWIRAANADWKMGNVPEVLLHYRKHASQITSRMLIQQQVLNKKIQFRYWQSKKTLNNIKPEWVYEIQKARDPVFSIPNMDFVDLAFTTLLKSVPKGEARNLVFNYLTQTYLRTAGTDSSVIIKWNKLHKQFGNGYSLKNKFKLLFVTVFQIKPNNSLLVFLRNIRFYLTKIVAKQIYVKNS